MSERKPLTLEELRQMDGKPVLFVSLKDGRRKWRVVQSVEKLVEVVKVICFTDDGGETAESYGKTWLAYAAELPSLDRSAWTAEWIWPSNEFNLPKCSKCGCNSKDATYGHKSNFCPKCGRAMNDSAWEMLERRIARHEHQ